jgi:hypothetical protein
MGLVWSVEMEPFDLVGGEVSSGTAKVVSWSVTVPDAAGTLLGERSRDVAKRVNYLKSQPHVLPLPNATFEDRRAEGSVPDWVYSSGEGMVVEVDRTTGSGSPSSLHLASRGAGSAVWIRSSAIAAPTTGRLQMRAKVRVADAAKQPQLRLAIEGRLDGQPYYRRINYGAAEREGEAVAGPLNTEWTTCSIARTDLPLAGLTDLRVGFDLMSEGEVWIDEVQIQDLWLADDAVTELLKSAATAEYQARSGGLQECRLFVDGYWPSSLRRQVQLPDGREVPPMNAAGNIAPPPIAPAAARGKRAPAADSAKKQNWLERSAERNKSWWPSWPKWK